jgi:fused signal recognition particle receptor
VFEKLRARLAEIKDKFSGGAAKEEQAAAPPTQAPSAPAAMQQPQKEQQAPAGQTVPQAAKPEASRAARATRRAEAAAAGAPPPPAPEAPQAKTDVKMDAVAKRSLRDERADAFEGGLLRRKLDEDDIAGVLEDLEVALYEGDIAHETVEAMKQTVQRELHGAKVGAFGDKGELIQYALRIAVENALPPDADFDATVRDGARPFVIMFVGINGTGKTTTIARLAHRLKKQGMSPVIAACDTFRAGAIDQLEVHATRLGVKLIKNQPGSDPASVAFDAIEHAKARGKEVVLVDTAGRMQTNTNLMDEMKKMKRVAKPHLTIFVGDAWVGNDAVNQARAFHDAVGIDGVVLTKIDTDAKGGAALSIAHAIGKPIFFVGTGQDYDDLQVFSRQWMIERIFGGEK